MGSIAVHAISEIQPAVDYVADQLERPVEPAIPIIIEGYAHMLSGLFDDIRQSEKQCLESDVRDRSTLDKFRTAYYRWLKGAKVLIALADKATMSETSKVAVLRSHADEATSALAEYAKGEAGAKRLAEFVRENPWG